MGVEKDVERLHIHIAGLEATLTKRNNRIAELEAALTAEGQLSRESGAIRREYRRGFQDACNRLMSITASAANALGRVRKDAFDVYLSAEKHADWPPPLDREPSAFYNTESEARNEQ
jgi:hypothetical protein